MQVTVHKAKTDLSKLIAAAEAGEDVVIARGNKPAVRLVPVEMTSGFRFGGMEFLKGTAPNFLEPMTEEELADWEGRDGDRPL